jgi:Tol biopolymer transport system component
VRARAAWLLTAATLVVVVTMIAVGAARLSSRGENDIGAVPASTPSPSATDDGSDARVVDLRTGDVSKLPSSIASVPFDCCYSTSRDGARIAFVGMAGTSEDQVPGRYGILVADVDGSDVRLVATDAQGATKDRPQWSPDGTEIVYERESDGALVVVDIAEGVATPIADGHLGEYTQPTYSADGRTILFTRGDPAALWTVAAAGGRESVLVEPGAYGTYSPDGKTIAYTWVGTDGYRGIWLAGADGGHARPGPSMLDGCCVMGFLVGKQERSRAAWSPDGTRIAASLFDGGPVVVVDLEAKGSQRVAESGQPVWLDDHTLILDNYKRVVAD